MLKHIPTDDVIDLNYLIHTEAKVVCDYLGISMRNSKGNRGKKSWIGNETRGTNLKKTTRNCKKKLGKENTEKTND